MELFNLNHDHDLKDIKKKYRELSKLYHPDKGGDVATYDRIQQAYDELLKNKTETKINVENELNMHTYLQREFHKDTEYLRREDFTEQELLDARSNFEKNERELIEKYNLDEFTTKSMDDDEFNEKFQNLCNNRNDVEIEKNDSLLNVKDSDEFRHMFNKEFNNKHISSSEVINAPSEWNLSSNKYTGIDNFDMINESNNSDCSNNYSMLNESFIPLYSGDLIDDNNDIPNYEEILQQRNQEMNKILSDTIDISELLIK